ncbi:hypothetical protein N8491_02450 [Akkermansiaceae bacterium]|nr:hypothetical protein [Akkermansiaceae bacterium]MDB4388672.1 hypothetical protein [Akkermansiaceae bacterium]MDB4697220.1 hypothetical protein [Akkermansiaceae bacterium]
MADKKSLLNPFPGLRPFQSDEEYLFFGRENQTLELLQILRDNRFVGVIGTSGSGKSSLVRCGLLSELYGGSFLDAGTDWEVAVMNPGGGPFSQLSKALVSADIYDSEEDDIHLKLNATLRRSRLGLVEAIRQSDLPEGTNVLLVVDQFEEIFRYSEAGEEEGEAADDFVSMILEAAKQSSIPIYVIITMRSDYIGDCSKFEGLPEEINEGEYLIPRLSREEYKSVIEGPIKVGGGKLAPRLLQRLLNDIGTESDQLPCLQHALMRTWDAWVDRDEGEELDLEDYRAIGGMGKALSIHADEIFETFSDQGTREAATRMFRAITEKGDDNRGIRRPLRLQQLADITNHSIEEVKSVVDPYRQQGVTFLMPPSNRELEADTVIDISHESLMRVWQRLRNWVEEEAQSARIYRRLVDTSSLWRKEEAGLYHDPDLQIAQSWRDEYEPNEAWADLYGGGFEVATEFLGASEEEGRKAEREKELARQKELEQAQELAEARERSARTMKRFAAVVGVVAIIALGAMVFAVQAQKKAVVAQESAIEAKENLRINFARSDDSLGHSFAEQNSTSKAAAYFSRSLIAEPNNPTALDKIFNLFAYNSPPGYLSQKINFDGANFKTSAATKDGKIVITGAHTISSGDSKKRNIRIWDASDDGYIEVTNDDDGGVWYNSIDISPDEKNCVIGYGNRNLTEIIDLKTGETIQSIPLQGVLCRYSQDGSKILMNQGWKKATNIWDLTSNSSILEIDTKDFYPEWNLDESKIVFGAHSEQQSAVLDIESGEITTFDYDHPITTGASFSPDGNRILTHSHLEGNFYLWNLNTKELDATLDYSGKQSSDNVPGNNWTHPSAIGSFTPDGSKIITAAPNLTVQLWEASSGDLLQTEAITEIVLEFSKPVFSEDGQRILIPLRDGKCYIGELPNNYSSLPRFGPAIPITNGYAYLANNGEILPLFLPQRGITSSKLLRSTNEILIGTDRGEVKIFNTSSGQKIGPTIRHAGKIVSVDENNAASMLATSSDVGSIKVWDKKNLKEPILSIGVPTPDEKLDKQNIYFGSEGKTIWIHSNRGTECWNINSKEKIYEWKNSWRGKVSRKSRDGMTSIAANENWVRIFDMNDGKEPSSIGLQVGSPITDFLISNHKKFVAVSSEDNFLRIWDVIDRTDPKFELEFDSVVNSLDQVQGSNLVVAGCASGRIYIIDQDKGIFTDHLEMQGQGPCVEIATNSLGHIAAIFKTSNGAYSAAFELSTGRPLTGELNNGTNVTEIKFTHDEAQIICLPSDQEGDDGLIDYHNDVATVWPILINDGKPINSDLPKIITALGGLELNPEGITIEDNSLEELNFSVRKLDNSSLTGKFFKWLLEFPGNRRDSPFRDPVSERYIDVLSQQNNLILLQENLRLRREDALAITRNAIYELVINGENNPSVIKSSLSELETARSLNDENPEILYYSAIAFEYAGDIKLAASYYELATKAEPLSKSGLLNIIDAQNRLSVSNQQRLLLLSKAIDQSESESEKAALIIDKFNFCVGERFYTEIDELWAIIKDWDLLPATISPKSILEKYISVKEAQASELADQSEYEKAIELLKPAAIASLATNQNSISSSVANLIEWENIDNQAVLIIEPDAPWKYQDNGVDQGDDWRQSNFDDGNWKEGSGKFGYGGDGETTKLSWGDDRNNKVTTYYFRHTFNIDESSKRPFLVADLIKDDGVVIYLNGNEVIRNSMPLGDIDFSSFSAKTAWEHNNNGPENNELFVHRHVIPEESLKLGRNVIAAELHQCNKGSSDLGFKFELYGSNQTPIDYINEITNGTEGSNLMRAVEDLIPRQIREEKFIAINIALGNISREAVVDIDLETLVAGFKIAEKLSTNDVILEFSDIAVQALEENPTPENLTKRVELLNIKMNLLRKTGLNKQAISDLVDIIVSPPRAENLPTELIDLSAYYNAGLFHYSSWHADSEKFDLRFLPEKYDGPIDFDLRGIIQLNSGLDDHGKTANDYGHVLNNYKKYPTSVKNIEINSKAQKAHFLVGAIFGHGATTGKTAITVVFNYSDGSKSEMEIKAQQDIFDWWSVGNADKIPNENIGFLGENNLGNGRFLQKPVWINPHPEKVISHIDLNSGLINMAPFVVAITFE